MIDGSERRNRQLAFEHRCDWTIFLQVHWFWQSALYKSIIG